MYHAQKNTCTTFLFLPLRCTCNCRAVQTARKFEQRYYEITVNAIVTPANRLSGVMTSAAELVSWEVRAVTYKVQSYMLIAVLN